MHLPACTTTALATAFLFSVLSIHALAAPQTLKSKIEAYLNANNVHTPIPASVSYGNKNVDVTCGILNAYRDLDLVTAKDGQEYITQAEQHW